MLEHECERCGVIFKMKKHLVQHLNKRVECISINSERSRNEILEDIEKRGNIKCERCGGVYKNGNSLRVHLHRCKGIVENVKEELEKRIKELEGMIKKKEKIINQVANTIDNSTNNDNSITNNNNITNNITVLINDIDSINGIDYILKDPKFVERILKWVRLELTSNPRLG